MNSHPDRKTSFGSTRRLRIGSAAAARVVAAGALLGLLGSATSAEAYDYTLIPAEDAYVQQSSPNANYGSSSILRVRYTTTGSGQHSFLRFDIPQLSGPVVSATLKLRAVGAISEVSYYHVDMGDPNWKEDSITWNNWTAGGTTFQFLGSTSVAAGGTLSIDVTPYITQSSKVTFGLTSAMDVANQRFYSEEGAVEPTLTIMTSFGLATCGQPNKLLAEVNSLIQTGNLAYGCKYEPRLDADFSEWQQGSQNLPVVAAAVALWDGPVVGGVNYRDWWQSFFNHQASATGTAKVDHFKGTELYSNVYDAAVVAAVIATNYWAHVNSDVTLRTLAEEYLRRSWYAWALATSPQGFDRVFSNHGTTRTQVAGDGKTCPTLALASPRSTDDFGGDTKRWMLAKFLSYNENCYKLANHKPLLDYIASQYNKASGLTTAEVNALRALINNTTIPGDLAAVFGPVRMKTDYHFLLWNDGRRATYYLGSQLNNNVEYSQNKHTVFTAMFDRSTRDLDVLFAVGQNNNSCLDTPTRRIFVDDPGGGCSSTEWITLPANPTYHFVLGTTGWRTCSTLAC